ncbi:MAG: hypothetical protein ACR2ND_07085 [Solirubrobacteraceae bacterium]
MQGATLTRRLAGPSWLEPLREVPERAWARGAFAVLCLVALIGFFVYPTYPIYDSYYSLIWGREALHLHALSFHVYRAPTEHPAAIAFGGLLSLAGNHADRLLVGATIGSFMVLSAGLYRLARLAFTPIVGALAVVLLITRFNLSFLAVRGYVDIPYLAVVVWAAALEAERPRRGLPVFALLFVAELLRPEAWLLGGLYFLWCAYAAPWRERFRFAAITAAGPLIWASVDLVETGDPLFSLHSTSGLAATLGRSKGLGAVPTATWQYLVRLDKLPVIVAAIAGLLICVSLVPKRVRMPGILLAVGLGTFVLIGAAGLSVIDRYLLVPSLMVIVFGAAGLGGWTMLAAGGRLRRAWASAAALLLAYGVLAAVSTVSVQKIQTELGFRGDSHTALAAILSNRRVRSGLRCGPLSVPNHKLVPDARWELHRGPAGVIARSDARLQAQHGHIALLGRTMRGVALYPTGLAVERQALVDTSDDPRDQVPLAGFQRVATTQYYGAYVRC